MSKYRFFAAILILNSLFSCPVYASTQTFVDGYKLNHTKIENGFTYVQLRELSHYMNYDLEYDETTGTVNFYKINIPKPMIQRETSLFPSNVEEVTFEGRKEIIKTYELSAGDSPKDISKEPFEKDGFSYVLTDITKSSTEGVDTKTHSETVTLNTSSQDMNTILRELPESKEFQTDEGYNGILYLDISSIQSGVKGYKNSNYTISETRQYPNLSSADTSLVPKTIQAQGKTLKLASVSWKTSNTATVDYEQLADTYTAIATYTGTGTKSSVTGYTTTAVYRGDISKTIQGKTLYTAYFSGTAIEETSEPTVSELKEQLKVLKAKEKAEANGQIFFNPFYILVLLLILSGIGGMAYLLFFRRNVTVFSMVDGEFRKIGKTRVQKKTPVIDLTGFTSKVTVPSFIVVIDRFSAKSLNEKTVTINYGDSSFQHIVTLIDNNEKKKGYQIEVDF